MTTTAAKREETQVFQVSIKATPQAIWDAITSPDWNGRYGYGARGEYDLRPGRRGSWSRPGVRCGIPKPSRKARSS